MRFIVTVPDDWAAGLDADEIESIKEELEGEVRYRGAYGVLVEAE